MAPEALTRVLGERHRTGTGYQKGHRWCWGVGEAEERRWQGRGVGLGVGAGLEGIPVSLPHMSFDVIQAKGHTLVCAAPFGLLLALSSSAQLVFNNLGQRWGGKRLDRQDPGPRAAPPVAPPQRPAPPYLIGVVEELQYCEDAGPNKQPHLAPNVTCRSGEGTGRSGVSGHRGSSRAPWDRGRQVAFAKRWTAFV